MTEHSIEELKRQLDQARSHLRAAENACRHARERYDAALRQAHVDALAKRGIVLGETVVSAPHRWRGDESVVGVASDVQQDWSAWALVLLLLRKDGSVGKKEHKVPMRDAERWEVVGHYEPPKS